MKKNKNYIERQVKLEIDLGMGKHFQRGGDLTKVMLYADYN